MVAAKPHTTLLLAGFLLVLNVSTRTTHAQTFKSTGNMATGRIGHTATLLNGGKVLVTTGVKPSFNYITSAELYDPYHQCGTLRSFDRDLQPDWLHSCES
jgi:hypothetical protein